MCDVELMNYTIITQKFSPAVVAWFVKASVFHAVNYAPPSVNGGSNLAGECCVNRLNSTEFVTIQIAKCWVLFGGFMIQAPGISC